MKAASAHVALRPRSPWESMDLGVAMVRAWWRGVYACALPAVGLLAGLAGLLSAALATGEGTLLFLFAVWWCKPALDRICLGVLAPAVFDGPPGPRRALARLVRELPQRLRGGLVWQLTLGRFDPVRSFHLPVWQLEGLTGVERRERFRTLDAGVRGRAVWLTVTYLHIEAVLVAAVVGAGLMLAPADSNAVAADAGALLAATSDGVLAIAYLIGMALVEPAYVASGFALYLGRRTVLEGWDIELQFRRLGARLSGAGHDRAARRR